MAAFSSLRSNSYYNSLVSVDIIVTGRAVDGPTFALVVGISVTVGCSPSCGAETWSLLQRRGLLAALVGWRNYPSLVVTLSKQPHIEQMWEWTARSLRDELWPSSANAFAKVIWQILRQHFLGQPSLAMDLWEEKRSLKRDSSQKSRWLQDESSRELVLEKAWVI